MGSRFGYQPAPSRLTVMDVADQRIALLKLAEMTQRSTIEPNVLRAARQITGGVADRDDAAELQAIFDAVKSGDPRVAGMENGIRYVADPNYADAFMSPSRMLKECRRGACSGDCDDQTAMVCALGGAVGFKMGLRAWGPHGSRGEFVHVYPVALLPKRLDGPLTVVGMDTTVPESFLGWEPEEGEVLTAWLG